MSPVSPTPPLLSEKGQGREAVCCRPLQAKEHMVGRGALAWLQTTNCRKMNFVEERGGPTAMCARGQRGGALLMGQGPGSRGPFRVSATRRPLD